MEYVYEKPKSSKRKYVVIIALVIVLAIFFVFYGQIFSYFSAEGPLDEEQCAAELEKWCDNCLTVNGIEFESWTVPGDRIGRLAECSVYYNTSLSVDRDCINSSDICKGLVFRDRYAPRI